jgi:AcrR family transcriptional regulator
MCTQRVASLLPPRATADGTHRRLQEAALLLFGERGYHGVSIRDLADAAGITASSIYTHVAAKEDLLTEVVLIGHEEHHDRLRDALLSSPPEPHAQLANLVRAHVGVHITYPLLARVSNNELHALSVTNRMRVTTVRDQSVAFFLDVINRGTREAAFHVRQPWLTVAAIGAMGIRVAEWYSPEMQLAVEDVIETYTDFALKLVT